LNKKIVHLGTSSNNTLPPVTYRSKEKLSEAPMSVKPHIVRNFFERARSLQTQYVVEEINIWK
jgi:hypothetical protein